MSMLARRPRLVPAVLAAVGLLGLFAPMSAARTRSPLELALRFQPHLFFDTAERWRPIDVDAFLAEPGHQVCPPPASGAPCAPLRSVGQLTSAAAYLDLRGTRADGSDAAAPGLATCVRSKAKLLDCDLGRRSVIYAHVSRAGQRLAIDYWWFLRYNAFSIDLHEGDWEGVTVIADAAGRQVQGVHFAAHSTVWRYPSRFLRIDRARHVRVYLARGDHAAYPRPCARSSCRQTQSTLREGRFDGRSPWVDNDVAACARHCVRLLPEVGGAPASWDAWNGLWGVPHSVVFAPPRTPAFQVRYQHPFAATRSQRHVF